MSLSFLSAKRLETSKHMTDHLINIDENAESQDIDVNINCELNSSKKKKYKSIFISLELFEYSKLLSTNFTSIEIRSFDTIKMPRSLIDFLNINRSSSITIMNHFNSILSQFNQFNALYFDKTNVIDFLHY